MRSIDLKKELVHSTDGNIILRIEKVEEKVLSPAALLSYKHELEHEKLRLKQALKECEDNLVQVQEALDNVTTAKD